MKESPQLCSFGLLESKFLGSSIAPITDITELNRIINLRAIDHLKRSDQHRSRHWQNPLGITANSKDLLAKPNTQMSKPPSKSIAIEAAKAIKHTPRRSDLELFTGTSRYTC